MSSLKLKGSTSGDVTITVPAVAGTNTVTIPAASGKLPLSNLDHVTNRPNAKPLIINGDMKVAQRGTSQTGQTGNHFPVDRFGFQMSNFGTWTSSQSSDVPTGKGFATSLKLDCTTADASLGAGDFGLIHYRMEGRDVQLLKKGTASAEKVTVSFWVKSAKTGTYILEIFDSDNARQISQSYTISSANTWEQKILVFDGDTIGAYGNDNGSSLAMSWWLGAGSTYSSGTLSTTWTANTNADRAVGVVNLADSTSNDWYLTGVQMEVGEYDATTIPPFQHETFQDIFFRCQRYYQNQGVNFYGMTEGTTFFRLQVPFDRPMRAAPSTTARGVGFKFNARYLGDYTTDNPTIASAASTTFGVWLGVSGTGLTGNIPIYGRSLYDAAGQFLALNAEL